MGIFKTLTLATLVFAVAFKVHAQPNVTVSMYASPERTRMDETIQLQIEAKATGARIDEVKLPNLDAFEVISQQVSKPIQINFNLGSGAQVEATTVYTFGLRALQPGIYNIEPSEAIVDNQIYKSNPITIVIEKNELSEEDGGTPEPENSEEKDEDLSGAKFNPKAFLQTVVTPVSPYIGQQIDVNVYLYVRGSLPSQTLAPTNPSMDGFWVHDIPIRNLRWREETVRGIPFRVTAIEHMIAFPQKSGKLTIGTPKVMFNISSGGFFSASKTMDISGVPIEIDVKELPGNPHAATGDYTLKASLDQTRVKTGDALTLRVTAHGEGNVQNLNFELPPIDGVRTLQPVVKDKTRLAHSTFQGQRSWEWILITQTPGTHTIPALELPYFNPAENKYYVAKTQPISFTTVGAPTVKESTIADQTPTSEAPTFGPLRTQSALQQHITPIIQRTWFQGMLALPSALFILLVLTTAAHHRRQKQKATSNAIQRKLINEAHQALKRNEPATFYDRIVASITHALDAQLPIRIGSLPHKELRNALGQSFDKELIDQIIDELEGVDFARFAASGVPTDEMEQCYHRTLSLIKQIMNLENLS